MIPVKPWTFQTSEPPFGPSYFAIKYVKPPVPRSIDTCHYAKVLIHLELKMAAGHVPQLALCGSNVTAIVAEPLPAARLIKC